MTSHEYVKRLREIADYLETRPAFTLSDWKGESAGRLDYYFDKEEFLAAVRALGSGKKSVETDSLGQPKVVFTSGPVQVLIEQDKVCRIIEPARPAVYDCEPLLSELEDASLSQ